jgi:CPA1 family monovalent cation:H+ antiporter
MLQAVLDTIQSDTSHGAIVLRQTYEAALIIAGSDTPQAATIYESLTLEMIPKQREALRLLRRNDEIGDEAYHRLHEELDWAELAASPAGRFQPLTTD